MTKLPPSALDLINIFCFLNVSESMVPEQILKFVEIEKRVDGYNVEILEIMFENNFY